MYPKTTIAFLLPLGFVIEVVEDPSILLGSFDELLALSRDMSPGVIWVGCMRIEEHAQSRQARTRRMEQSSVVEHILTVLPECFVYKIGPRPSAKGYKSANLNAACALVIFTFKVRRLG